MGGAYLLATGNIDAVDGLQGDASIGRGNLGLGEGRGGDAGEDTDLQHLWIRSGSGMHGERDVAGRRWSVGVVPSALVAGVVVV